MTLEEALNADRLCYWEYGSVVECKPTGRYIMARMDSLATIEVRDGWFSKKWKYLPQLNLIEVKK